MSKMRCLHSTRTPVKSLILLLLFFLSFHLLHSSTADPSRQNVREKRSQTTPGLLLILPSSSHNKIPNQASNGPSDFSNQVVKRDDDDHSFLNRQSRFEHDEDYSDHQNSRDSLNRHPNHEHEDDGNLLRISSRRNQNKEEEEDYDEYENNHDVVSGKIKMNPETLHLLQDMVEYFHMHDLKNKNHQYNRRYRKLAQTFSELKKRDTEPVSDDDEKENWSNEENEEEGDENGQEEEEEEEEEETDDNGGVDNDEDNDQAVEKTIQTGHRRIKTGRKSHRRAVADEESNESKTFVDNSQKFDLATVTGIAFIICGVVITSAYWLTLRPPKSRSKGREQTKVVRSSSDFEV